MPLETYRRIHCSFITAADRASKESNVTQRDTKKASLELARTSFDSQVFGDDIKLTLSLLFVKTCP